MFRSVARGWLICSNFSELTNKIYGVASKMGGSSSDSLYDLYAGKFFNKDLEEFKQEVYHSNKLLPGVTIITTKEECQRCLDVLMAAPEAVAAWDTETMDLDIKQEAPVGKGKIICASFFAGPEYNFGRGPRVFIDNFGHNAGLLQYFRDYLQSQTYKKVWHNYGFDRHMFFNHGINVRGFAGDTMHMARLQDSSKTFGKYSLAELTKDFSQQLDKEQQGYKFVWQEYDKLKMKAAASGDNEKQEKLKQRASNIEYYMKNPFRKDNMDKKGRQSSRKDTTGDELTKTKMEKIFGRRRVLKNGTEGAAYEYPTTLTLHTNAEYLMDWITYSVVDSESTFYLKKCLEKKLRNQKSNIEQKSEPNNMWLFYQKYWLPLGEVLTDLEREGIRVDLDHMKKIQEQATHDLKKKEEFFLNFLYTFQRGKNIDHFNPSSTLQLQQLLFAPCQLPEQTKQKQKDEKKEELIKSMQKEDKQLMEAQRQSEEQERNGSQKKYQIEIGTSKTTRKPVVLNELVKTFKVQNKHGPKPKYLQMEVMGLGLPYEAQTPTGLPAVDLGALQELAGNPQKEKWGKAYTYFKEKGNPEFGKQLCQALRVLVEYNSSETLLKTFIQPLQGYVDSNSRVHCSLNINTETGRLSARKPNLQNQPALDKDVYKIRKAFVAGKGNKFIVADYGQLQLRVLAHLTNCKAMLDAFKQGGDFHSRTAIGMYDYIRREIQEGTILIEWDKSKGQAPVPLLKQKYAAERKKAKTVNFSIAYGKTARGFSSDWGCTLDEAKQVIDAWFKERKEVELWQKGKQKIAKQDKVTQTLMGRKRNLEKFYQGPDPNNKKIGMANRRAINTPVQGGAADIVNASMVKIGRDERLRSMGWKLLMQIHDELILEGPEESAEQAYKIVKEDMENPFDFKLRVDLEVDAKIGDNWYECK